MAVLPNIGNAREKGNNRFHFVGLGSAGTTAMVQCKKAGFEGNYSCITGPNVSHLTKDMHHLFFVPAVDLLYSGINYGKSISLTPEMKSIFKDSDMYIIFTGLGSFTGTGLISSVLEYLAAEKKNYVAICSLPFINEGRARNEYAKSKKSELERMRNVLFFDHNQILTDYPHLNQHGISKAFAKGDEIFCSIFIHQGLPIIKRM